jgi:hypothetical protein
MTELTFACIVIVAALGMGGLTWWLIKRGTFRPKVYYAYSHDHKTVVRMTNTGSIFSVIIQYPSGVCQHRVIHFTEVFNLIDELDLDLDNVVYEESK